MRHYDVRIERQLHGDPAEDRRDYHEYRGERGRAQHSSHTSDASLPSAHDRCDEQHDYRDGHSRRDVAVGHLDDEIRSAQGRYHVSVARGPVISTPHSGSTDPHYRAEHDLDERRHERDVAEPPERGHLPLLVTIPRA